MHRLRSGWHRSQPQFNLIRAELWLHVRGLTQLHSYHCVFVCVSCLTFGQLLLFSIDPSLVSISHPDLMLKKTDCCVYLHVFTLTNLSHYILLCFLTELQSPAVFGLQALNLCCFPCFSLSQRFCIFICWASLTLWRPVFTVFLKMEEDLRGLAFNVQRIVLFCPHQGRVWVTQAKVMSALEKEKDTRGSPTQKQGLGSAVLGIGETSENGANCGEYKALAMQGASIRCQGLCLCVSVCAFPHSFVCFVSHLSLETLVEVGLSTGCQTNLI